MPMDMNHEKLFRVRIPTRTPNVALSAEVRAGNWRDALRAVLVELDHGTELLERANVHLRQNGRVVIEDPLSLRLFEVAHADDPPSDLTPPAEASRSHTEPQAPLPDPVAVAAPVAVAHEGGEACGALEAETAAGAPQRRIPSEQLPIVMISVPPTTKDAPAEARSEPGEVAPLRKMDLATVVVPSPWEVRRADAEPEAPQEPPGKAGPLAPSPATPKASTADRFDDLRRGRNLEMVAGALLRSIRERFSADAGVVLVPDARRRHLRVAAGFGLPGRRRHDSPYV